MVYSNDLELPIKNFIGYIELYTKENTDDLGASLKVIHEKVNKHWEVAVTLSDRGFQQVSFVNSIATTKGGRHVDQALSETLTHLVQNVKQVVLALIFTI